PRSSNGSPARAPSRSSNDPLPDTRAEDPKSVEAEDAADQAEEAARHRTDAASDEFDVAILTDAHRAAAGAEEYLLLALDVDLTRREDELFGDGRLHHAHHARRLLALDLLEKHAIALADRTGDELAAHPRAERGFELAASHQHARLLTGQRQREAGAEGD